MLATRLRGREPGFLLMLRYNHIWFRDTSYLWKLHSFHICPWTWKRLVSLKTVFHKTNINSGVKNHLETNKRGWLSWLFSSDRGDGGWRGSEAGKGEACSPSLRRESQRLSGGWKGKGGNRKVMSIKLINILSSPHLSATLSDVKRLLKQLLLSSRVLRTIMFTTFPIRPRHPKTEKSAKLKTFNFPGLNLIWFLC